MDNRKNDKRLAMKYKLTPIATIIFIFGVGLSVYLIPNDSSYILLRPFICIAFLIPYMLMDTILDYIYRK